MWFVVQKIHNFCIKGYISEKNCIIVEKKVKFSQNIQFWLKTLISTQEY